MTASAYSLRRTLGKLLIQFKRPSVPLGVALRNTLAIILALTVGVVTGHAVAGTAAAAGALITMSADQPGHYLQRLLLIGSVTLAGTLSALVGFAAGAHPLLLLFAFAVWGFVAGMLVLFGPRGARIGTVSVILLAVATMYRGLARHARQPLPPDAAPPATLAVTELQRTLLGRPHSGGRAMEAFHTLLDLAERIRLELMALSTTKSVYPIPARLETAIAEVLTAIADALQHAEPPLQARAAWHRLRNEIKQMEAQAPPDRPFIHLHSLLGQLGAAVRNSNWAGSRGEVRAHVLETRLPRALRITSPWATIRANLNLRSIAFRHAIRLMLLLVLASFLSSHTGIEHGYWLPMTTAIVLRPDFGATLSFGLLRMLGTVFGLLFTTLLLMALPANPWIYIALMALLCFLFRYVASAHYGLAVVALTGAIVILLTFQGEAPDATAVERVLNTLMGASLALIAYLVWPTWERSRSRTALADMLQQYAGYLACLAAAAGGAALRDARSHARSARSNAQASIDRLRSEPATDSILLEYATQIMVAGNRLVRTAMSIDALSVACRGLPHAPATQAYLTQAMDHLQTLANALEANQKPAITSLREPYQALARQLDGDQRDASTAVLTVLCDRLADNMDTLAHLVGNLDRIQSHQGRSA